ncbi:zinc finger, RING-CH-type, zinc finger, RING/FYVE/PHD-type containing protein [Tanacetum coccineum]
MVQLLFMMILLKLTHTGNSDIYRVWQEMPILVIVSMLAYFCFLEQLLVKKMYTGSIALSLPFSCILGLVSSMTASAMGKSSTSH